jgi:N-acetylmuramoyl-L-alanine amidase
MAETTNTFDERFYFDVKPAEPPAQAAQQPAAPQPAAPAERVQFTTVIDPGHGDYVPLKGNAAGVDPGFVRTVQGGEATAPKRVEERTLNLALSSGVQDFLKKRGFGITMTHEGSDLRIDGQPHEKAEYNQFRTAVNRDAGAFVSIHHDNASPQTHGVVVYYNKDSQVSGLYAKVLAGEIGRGLKEHVDVRQDERDLGVLQRDRHMRNDGTEQPAVLIEAANMNHDADLNRTLDPTQRRDLVAHIGSGIVKAHVAVEGPIALIPDPNVKVPLPRPRPPGLQRT